MAGLLTQLAETVSRTIPVPEDPDSVTDIGRENPEAADEAVWSRVVDLFRTGVHPGIQLCIRHQGRVVLDRAIGYARGMIPGRAPARGKKLAKIRTRTPVNLFSAAKGITAIVMHKLEADGVLSLHQPIADYLPGFEKHGKARITLNQILTHQAGIPSMPAEALDLDLLNDPDTLRNIVIDLKPTSTAGGPPAYHTISGGFVAEVVVREITGLSLRDILLRDFKQPLGLRWLDYGVALSDTPQVAQNVITGFRQDPVLSQFMQRLLGMTWEQLVELSNDPRFNAGVIPSGNVITTARDVSAVYQCILNGGEFEGKRILQKRTCRLLQKAAQTGFGIDRMIGLPMRYGSGFMLGTRTISLYGWNHPNTFGHIGMSNTFTWADPDRALVVALLTTGKPVLGPHLLALPKLINEIHRRYPTMH